MNIPIENLYYLLVYAWNALDEKDDLVGISEESKTRIVDLFAAVLQRGINRLLRRGIDRGYVAHRDEFAGLRGKFDLAATIKSSLLCRGRTVCEFDELTHNVLHNQILRTTVRRLLRVPQLPVALREELIGTDRRLHEIDVIRLSRRTFGSVQLHRNNRFYRFLLHVCRILYRAVRVNEETGEVEFRDFVRDKRRMRVLFERFLLNFYRREQQQQFPIVKSERIKWAQTIPNEIALLPKMRTDVSLISPERKIVIDAKFYSETLSSYRGKKSVRSAHLYQLFAYLKNLATRGGVDAHAEGILLYPKVDRDVDMSCIIHGHRVRVATVDLNRPWQDIHDRLLNLIQ